MKYITILILTTTVGLGLPQKPYEKADLQALEKRFNNAQDKPRLILLTSPT